MVGTLKKIKFPSQARRFLIILLCADTFYISLHILRKFALFSGVFKTMQDEVFDLSLDRGLGESFQYAKEFWIVILFLWLIFKYRKVVHTGWAFLFTYLLLDDMFKIHETMGTFLVSLLGFSPFAARPGALRYQDLGELGVSIFLGLLFMSLIGFAYVRSNGETRKTFHYLTGGLALIVFFGIAVDLIRDLPIAGLKLLHGLSVIEDGGEMLAMSLVCWYVYVMTGAEMGMP